MACRSRLKLHSHPKALSCLFGGPWPSGSISCFLMRPLPPSPQGSLAVNGHTHFMTSLQPTCTCAEELGNQSRRADLRNLIQGPGIQEKSSLKTPSKHSQGCVGSAAETTGGAIAPTSDPTHSCLWLRCLLFCLHSWAPRCTIGRFWKRPVCGHQACRCPLPPRQNTQDELGLTSPS